MHKKIWQLQSGMLSKLYKLVHFLHTLLYWLAIFAGFKVQLRPLLSTVVGFLAPSWDDLGSVFILDLGSVFLAITRKNFWK